MRLSYIIKQHQRAYYDLIHDTELAINCGELTSFIISFCSFIYESINNVLKILTRKATQIHQYETKIFELFTGDDLTVNICLTLIYKSAFLSQGMNMEELMKTTGKSRNTIIEKLRSLPINFIQVDKRHRKNFYKLNALMLRN